jgi:predicted outer membrane repeat protein
MTNVLFHDNTASGGDGGAIRMDAGSPVKIINCSLVGNRTLTSGGAGGGISMAGGELQLANTILWNNTGTVGTTEEQQLTTAAPPATTVSLEHCIVDGFDSLTSTLGPGPLSAANPQFIDAPGGNLHLASNSAAINAGDASLLANVNQTVDMTLDLDGKIRIYGVEVDLGVYEFDETPVGIADRGQVPGRKIGAIESTLPNPFNPRVAIAFVLDRELPTKITVHDMRGRMIRVLENRLIPAGMHSITWDGTDDQHRSVASGVYIIGLEAGSASDSRKVTLVK